MKNLGMMFLIFFFLTASLFAQATKQDTLRELVRRIDILTRELERQKLGEVAERKYESKFGLGPAASQVYYKKTSGVSLAGYGEIVYENYADKKDDNSVGGKSNQIDYLRNIVYFGYKFNERFVFNAEIEFEHAKTGGNNSGSVAMEFGYIDAMLSPALTIRAGMVLVPVGIINEFHESTTFFGALRPETERNIIPSTWRANGIGILGATDSGWGYRLYFVEGLDAAKFSASGIRSGRQNGAKAVAENFALAGRLEYTGIAGLNIGASFYTGNSGQGLRDETDFTIKARTSILALHGLIARNGFEIRGLYARSKIGDVARLNTVRGFTGSQSIGEVQSGYYFTLAYDMLRLFKKGSEAAFQPFVQFEYLNNQQDVPVGFSADLALERTNFTIGFMYKPMPNIGLKGDYLNRDNEASSGLDQFNLAVTYLF